jgi:hypothetical protein
MGAQDQVIQWPGGIQGRLLERMRLFVKTVLSGWLQFTLPVDGLARDCLSKSTMSTG